MKPEIFKSSPDCIQRCRLPGGAGYLEPVIRRSWGGKGAVNGRLSVVAFGVCCSLTHLAKGPPLIWLSSVPSPNWRYAAQFAVSIDPFVFEGAADMERDQRIEQVG